MKNKIEKRRGKLWKRSKKKTEKGTLNVLNEWLTPYTNEWILVEGFSIRGMMEGGMINRKKEENLSWVRQHAKLFRFSFLIFSNWIFFLNICFPCCHATSTAILPHTDLFIPYLFMLFWKLFSSNIYFMISIEGKKKKDAKKWKNEISVSQKKLHINNMFCLALVLMCTVLVCFPGGSYNKSTTV